ncbi:MAG: hypothetical protein ACLQIB_12675 [Isosphaeraceae bacterium]
MPKTPARYRLVIFDEVADPQDLRDPVCRATGRHPTDVVQWLARAPGTWPEPLEEPAVRAFLDALFEGGIAAEAWRSDQFPDLSPARTIHRAACLGDGFRIEGLRGEPTHWVPWDRIELIGAGRIMAEDEFRHVQSTRWPSAVVSGIRALALMKPRPYTRLARAARIPHDPVGEVVIVRRDPRIAFRAVENQMNYAYLGERRSTSAAENFPVFVADLCARADDAFITPSTRSLLTRQEPGEHAFPSSAALLDYVTHRLLWSWYRRDRDAQAEGTTPRSRDDDDADEQAGPDPEADTDDEMDTM